MPRKVKDDGRTTRWDAHRDQRRADLVLAAVRAIDRHGPDAGIADIAAEAGVSKPVLYRYFADKDELHAAVGQWGANEVLSRMIPALTRALRCASGSATPRTPTSPRSRSILRCSCSWCEHRGADALADGKAAIAAAFARFLGDTLRDLGIDAAGAEPWSHGLVGLGLSTGEWWLERRTMSRAAVAQYLSAFVWHALDGAATDLGVPLSAVDHPSLAAESADAPPPTPIKRKRS